MRKLQQLTLVCLFITLFFVIKAKAATLIVGLDMSLSNPLVTDSVFADIAAQYVADDIAKLKEGDTLRITTFGARTHAANMREVRTSIKRNGAKRLSQKAKSYITQTVKSDENKQGSTNLLAWLELQDFHCEAGGKIIVVTDGIEASDAIDPTAFLDGKQSLPAPDEFASFKGCEVVFYGLGVGWPAQKVKTLRKAWMTYFQQAGVPFTAVIK